MMPLVSVIMPAYNHEQFVGKAIQSIIDQTYCEIELIIIDDGSKDNTYAEIIKFTEQAKKRFVRFITQLQENKGVVNTISALSKLAQGEYIFFIASDDLAKKNAIESLVNFLSNNKNYGLAVGDNEVINTSGEVCYWDKDKNFIKEESGKSYRTFGQLLKSNRKDFGSYLSLYRGNYIPNGYLIRSDLYQKIEYPDDKKILEDWYLHLQIAKYAKMKFLNQVLFSYRWHDSNTVKNNLKMQELTENTRQYENEILNKIDFNKVYDKNISRQIKDCILYGKNWSILKIVPNWIELRKIKKRNGIKAFLIRLIFIDLIIYR